MKQQAFNPYLPAREYIPDGEPYLVDGRVYVFGSHDLFGGSYFCLGDYAAYSAPEDDLSDWRCEGVIYRKTQDPRLNEQDNVMFAPDVVQGKDGKWYLYYTLASNGVMSVAVSDTIAGKYEYLGTVRTPNGHVIGTSEGDVFHFDPGVLRDDDGRIYLYTGFSPRPGEGCDALMQGRRWEGSYCFELEDDMRTVRGEPTLVAPGIVSAKGTSFEKHPFFEASSIRKIGKKYYFAYSSVYCHELCYAVSDRPNGTFKCMGVLVSNGDVGLKGRKYLDAVSYMGNNHGGLVSVKGQWYIFYHRHTNRSSYSRQACAEKITFKNGKFEQAELTSCGLNEGPLLGKGRYPAYIACNLISAEGAKFSEKATEEEPCITQDGEGYDGPDPYIAGMRSGSRAGFKYFDLTETHLISVLTRGAEGILTVTDGKKPLAVLVLSASEDWAPAKAPLLGGNPSSPLYFTFEGDGAIDFKEFTLI